MAKLAEALREFTNDDDVVIEPDDDDIYEHPKVIFSPGRVSRSTTSGKGR
jgi:hypothetical protein